MIIRTVAFDPLKVLVNGAYAPVLESSFTDEEGNTHKIFYVIVNGEKRMIQNRYEIHDIMSKGKTLDEALVRFEEVKAEKLEKAKLET